ncbi:hypothetical protein AcW1_007099 [Taiwanofungus camphoratus]|nr:hypothetical protein AcW2_005910 [Antrodia cinnamomea]KAI0955545.1 hypothetical protein AcW1_007099 [Antrodia cinnamomea]
MADSAPFPQTSVFQVDQKRRRLTPDRARANYLCGQLRLRLQYAKLKVEHGWQRQNLNEVENLYFRHTQMHRPPPSISTGGRRVNNAHTASLIVASTSTSVPYASLTEGKLEQDMNTSEQILNSDHINGHSGSGIQDSSSSVVHAAMYSTVTSPTNGDTIMNDPLTFVRGSHHRNNELLPLQAGQDEKTATVVPHPLASHQVPPSAIASNYRPSSTPRSVSHDVNEGSSFPSRQETIPPPPTHNPPFSQFSSTPSNSSHTGPPSQRRETVYPPYPSQLFPQTQTHSQFDPSAGATHSMPSTSLPLPTPVAYQTSSASLTSSGSGLTYDAFWSSHGSSTQSYRNVLAQSPSLLPGGSARPTLTSRSSFSVSSIGSTSGALGLSGTSSVNGMSRLP